MKETRLRALLAASRIEAGRVTGGGPNIHATRNGQQVEVPPGWTWCSITTIAEDIQAATGATCSRAQARYAMRALQEEGTLQKKRTAVQEQARGRYGSLYRIPQDLTRRSASQFLDPLRMARLFYYGDPSDFTWGEIMRSHHTENGVERRPKQIGEEDFGAAGDETEKFVSLGRWRSRDAVGDREADVFIPWIVFDLDRESNLKRAFRDAQAIVRHVISRGIDERLVYAAFSGRKGFHVHVSTAAYGFPIFRSSDAAREVISRVMRGLGRRRVGPRDRDTESVRYDDNVAGSPRSMVRVEGSYHEATGARKTMWRGAEFARLGLEGLKERVEERPGGRLTKEAFDGMLEVQEKQRRALEEAHEGAHAALTEARKARRGAACATGTRSFGPTLEALIGGVREGEDWCRDHAGRSRAGYILACCCYESDGIRREAARRLAMPEDEDTENLVRAWNARCAPPMSMSRLGGALRSARRKVL